MGWIGVGLVLIAVLAADEAVSKAGAASYVVGGTSGWGIPAGGAATYTAWASQHTFRVGDVLVFNFGTGMHDVAQVTKAAYDGCTSTNPITIQTAGPASLTINTTGELYYICTFGQHCPLGQKLAINVTAASSTPPTQTPSPSPMLTPMPSSSSSSPSQVSMAPSPGPSGSIAPQPSSPASESSSATTIATIFTPFLIVALAGYAFLI